MATSGGVLDKQDGDQGVYDSEGSEEQRIAALRELTGISAGEEADMERHAYKDANESFGQKSLSPSGVKNAEGKTDKSDASKADKNEAAQLGLDDGASTGAAASAAATAGDNEKLDNLQRFQQHLRKHKKKYLVGGISTGGIGGFALLVFFLLLPLKILHIMENLQGHFFSTGVSAVQRRSEVLFSDYLKKHVMPGMDKGGVCVSTRTIDRTCVKIDSAASPASRLYRAWADARLENKLFVNQGIEIVRNTDRSFNLKINKDKYKADIPLAEFVNAPGVTNMFEIAGLSTNEARTHIRRAFEDETLWKRAMYRFKVGRLLERKYGIVRCLFACKVRDDYHDWTGKKANAAEIMLARRIIQPHSLALGIALECIISSSCTGGSEKPIGTDWSRLDDLEAKINKMLEQQGLQYTKETVQKITVITSEILKYNEAGSLSNYLVTAVLDKIDNQVLTDAVNKGIPVIGYINMAAQTIEKIAHAGPKIRRWGYEVMGAAAVASYMAYRTHVDETKSGNVDAEILGSMVAQLGDTAGNKGHEGQPAEVSPLYDHLLNPAPSAVASLINTLSPTAYAQGTLAAGATANAAVTRYTCDDNNAAVPAGKRLCPEESFVADNFLTKISDFVVNSLGLAVSAADAWTASIGRISTLMNSITGFIGGLVTGPLQAFLITIIPPIGAIEAKITQLTGQLLSLMASWLFPSLLYLGMSGARLFNVLASGAAFSASNFVHYGLGGALLTDAEYTRQVAEQEQQAQDEFAIKPFTSRMFDTTDSRSMVSQVALSVPTNAGVAAQNVVASLVSNPFTKLLGGFGSIFTSPKAHAAVEADDFGILRFGFTGNSAAITTDPETLTDAICAKIDTDWQAGVGQFEGTLLIDKGKTGADYHTAENPCILNDAAVGSAGAVFSDAVLNKDDLNVVVDNGAVATGGFCPVGESGTPPNCIPLPIPAGTWPSTPPALICGSALLSNPDPAPTGSLSVPAGNNSGVNFSGGNKTFYFEAGTHTGISNVHPGDNTILVGAPGAIIDGGGAKNFLTNKWFEGSTKITAHGTIIRYLTVQNYSLDVGQQQAGINQDGGPDLTIEYSTLQNFHNGSAVMVGPRNRLRYNCMTKNGQYAMNAYDAESDVADVVVDHNEISYNDQDNADAQTGLGASGGAKFWKVNGAIVESNYVHHNLGDAGLWMDTNNNDFFINGNYFSDNDGKALWYEIGFNTTISNNSFLRNTWKTGPRQHVGGVPEASLYLSETGGDARYPTKYSGGSAIHVVGNYFENNYNGISAYENADRFCVNNGGRIVNDTNDCPSYAPPGGCPPPIGTARFSDLWNSCRWQTKSLLVENNEFHMPKVAGNGDVPGCDRTTGVICGVTALFSTFGTVSDVYHDYSVADSIVSKQNNTWRNNKYFGDWQWFSYIQSENSGYLTFDAWQAGGAFNNNQGLASFRTPQDTGSTWTP